jgi:oxaloacetate decarboxylase alpha subunit
MAKLKVTDVILRDAHQSLLATRMTTADMLPMLPKLDKIGYWALEAWGGATFDTCMRFLNEDPWERLRTLKKNMPNTPIMMLLRGQNLLGYRHYADDVVDHFVAAAAKNGVDVFRIFDACNDVRNLDRAAKAAKKTGKHVQMTMSYAVTPFHTPEVWTNLAKEYAKFGADSICIKDMAGVMKPYEVEKMIKAIKKETDIPIDLHTHATTGMSVATILKAVESGVDIVDTAISAMSMQTSHSPTETIAEIFKGTEYDTGFDIKALGEIAAYFRDVRKKYAKFDKAMPGADVRILLSPVPGGMLTNMVNQLKEQNASDKYDQVLAEIPVVQKDCGSVPLVTPTSQIVGTQAVFNVLFGRYKKITDQCADLVTGRYGKTPGPVNQDLRAEALKQKGYSEVLECRPADKIPMEWDKMVEEAKKVGAQSEEDYLSYAMFPQVAPDFFAKRAKGVGPVDSASFAVPAAAPAAGAAPAPAAGPSAGATVIEAPVAGTVIRYAGDEGSSVSSGDNVSIMEAMKMKLEIKATAAGKVHFLANAGDQVAQGAAIAEIK